MKKTEFEELWSEIKYTDHFDHSKITFYFEDRGGLRPLKLEDITSKRNNMFTVNKVYGEEMEIVEIPEYRFWVVQYGKVLLYDNRKNYKGKKDLSISAHLDEMNNLDAYQPLIKAIKNYGWNEHLISTRLLISINYSRKGDLTLYNYNNLNLVAKDHPILVRCRGIVIHDTGVIVNYPFDRFFNHFEKQQSNIDWESTTVFEKLDGSLVCVFWYNKWYVTTRGAFYPLTYRKEGDFVDVDVDNFEILFRKHFKDFDKLNKDYCYMFELVTKDNPVVTRYDKEFVALIGMRNLHTLKEVPLKRDIAKLPRMSVAVDLENALALFSELKDDEEGLVVVDKYYNRIKLKQESYFLLSKIKRLKPEDLFDYVMDRIELDAELLQNDKNVVAEIEMMRRHWKDVLKRINEKFEELRDIDSRKSFAMEALKYSYSGALFAMLDNKFNVDLLRWSNVKDW